MGGGTEIAIDRALLPPLRKGQYYWTDLEGLRVVNQDGVEFGRVDHLFDSGAHPILVIRNGERERLVPFVLDHHVLSVDIEGDDRDEVRPAHRDEEEDQGEQRRGPALVKCGPRYLLVV